MNDTIQIIENQIDDYNNTVHAIVGFMNFYRYDAALNNVIVFQGRKLTPSDSPDKFVTPDIGILLPNKTGVLGEVKNNFPKDKSVWISDFRQLMRYDNDLIGWQTDDKKINSHDIVLLLHQSRTRDVIDFYNEKNGKEIEFKRPFIIVEYNRSDQRQAYFHFRKELGTLTETIIDKKLYKGVQVPMLILVREYSTIKIYDSEPPLPYMLYLIWDVIGLKASESPKYRRLAKNQKIEIAIEIEEIINQLHEGYSFKRFQKDNSDRQPRIPKREWIIRACEKLVSIDEAKWNDNTKQSITYSFKKHEHALEHFIEKCTNEVELSKQIELFDNLLDS